jgi:hypothetical protein
MCGSSRYTPRVEIQKAMKAKRQRRHGPKAAPDAIRDAGGAQAPLGSRIAARFAGLGLTQDVPELRGEEARTTALSLDLRCLLVGRYTCPGGAAVTIQLTEEQQQAIDSAGATPPKVVDPRTSAAYVLIPEDDYETVREILGEEQRQRAIRKVALRNAAGRIEEAP